MPTTVNKDYCIIILWKIGNKQQSEEIRTSSNCMQFPYIQAYNVIDNDFFRNLDIVKTVFEYKFVV